jgi:hypothetical protein
MPIYLEAGRLSRALLLSLFALLAACDGVEQQSLVAKIDRPDGKHSTASLEVSAVLERFIDASIARQYGEYYDLLSTKDQGVRTRQSFVDEKQTGDVTLADAFYDKISYRVEAVVIEEGQATVLVEYRYPDVEYMIKKQFGLSVLSDLTDQEIVRMKDELEQAYSVKPLPMKSRKREFTLLRQVDGWRVYLGWDRKTG